MVEVGENEEVVPPSSSLVKPNKAASSTVVTPLKSHRYKRSLPLPIIPKLTADMDQEVERLWFASSRKQEERLGRK